MGELGLDPAPIMRAPSVAPTWPKDVVGRLTHCDDYRAAVLAYSMQVRSIGIDAEPHGPLPDGVLDAVSLKSERQWLSTTDRSDVHWDRLLFCATEATYKAWEPLTGRWLGLRMRTSRSSELIMTLGCSTPFAPQSWSRAKSRAGHRYTRSMDDG